VFSPDGLLFPDTAGVYGLRAPSMIDALYVKRYWDYITTFVSRRLTDRFLGTGAAESAPNVAGNPMFDILGIRYVGYDAATGNAPPSWSGNQYRLLRTFGRVKIYENTHAGPGAFVVHDVHRVDDERAAIAYLKRGATAAFPDGSVQVLEKDVYGSAVVEADPGSAPAVEACSATTASGARIVSRSADQVKIDVESACAGLLVLSDQYFPGWHATVNGKDSRIYATDVSLRGVAVPAGHSTVEFDYRPSSFRTGLLLFAFAVVVMIGLGLSAVFWPRWKARRASPDRIDSSSGPITAQ
jgi:hypothetical protein